MLKRNWSLTGVSLAAIIFYAVCGLLLLLLPSEALAIANYAIAALLLVMGVVCIIGYFRGSVIIGQFDDTTGGEQYGIVLPKGSKLTPTVSAAVDRLASSGKLAELQEKWLNEAQNVPTLK